MITRLVAAVLLAAGLTAVPAAPTTAGGPTVSAANMQFTPATLRTGLGSTVTWSFPDAMVHTTTSTQGFWDSGSRSGGQTFERTFDSAGSFAYKCSFHPQMTGTVNVPVNATGSPGKGWKLRWATGDGPNATYDVQVRKGKKAWKALRTDTSAATAKFARKGSWSVRARTTVGSGTSGWSPVVVVKTS